MTKELTQQEKIEKTQDFLAEIVSIRGEIDLQYKEYNAIKKILKKKLGIEPNDFKRAVDAVHYLGGGWPSETTKGRMESLLDNFAGLYKILKLAGRESMFDEHLASLGLSVSIINEETFLDVQRLSPKDIDEISQVVPLGEDVSTKTILSNAIDACDAIQTQICKMADVQRDEILPELKEINSFDNPEADRIIKVARLAAKSKEEKTKELLDKVELSVAAFDSVIESMENL